MRARAGIAAIALLPLLHPAAGAAQSCPAVDPAAGYAITVTGEDAGVDSTWLADVASAAAYRWRVPSRRRNAYVGWERVQRRLLPPEPRWADDWRPEPRHRAVARLHLPRAGHARLELLEASGEKLFDRSLGSMADDPMPASPAFPVLPAGMDSVTVLLTFGASSDVQPQGRVRFAAVQTRIELERNTLRVVPPPGARERFPATTVKYDVTERGVVDPRSIEFLRPSGALYEAAIRDALLAARFRPPTSNCRPVAQTVVQTFGQ